MSKIKRQRGPFKMIGGKGLISPFIVCNFPKEYERLEYRDLFAGAGSVLLTKKPAKVECLNELFLPRYLAWIFIQDNAQEVIDYLSSLKYEEQTFREHKQIIDDWYNLQKLTDVFKLGMAEYVVRSMSRSGQGSHFSWQKRLRGGIPGNVNAWNTGLINLYKVSKRIRDVKLTNEDAIQQKFFTGNALLYLDPPYLHSTRKTKKLYECEMTDVDHNNLLDLCLASSCKIIISGYDSDLYNRKLASWNKKTKDVANHSGQSKKKERRLETIWMNY